MVGKRTEAKVRREKGGGQRTTAAIHETDRALPAHRELQFSGNHLSAARCYTFPPSLPLPHPPPARARAVHVDPAGVLPRLNDRRLGAAGMWNAMACPALRDMRCLRFTLLSFPSYRPPTRSASPPWSNEHKMPRRATSDCPIENSSLADRRRPCREVPRWIRVDAPVRRACGEREGG